MSFIYAASYAAILFEMFSVAPINKGDLLDDLLKETNGNQPAAYLLQSAVTSSFVSQSFH